MDVYFECLSPRMICSVLIQLLKVVFICVSRVEFQESRVLLRDSLRSFLSGFLVP